MDRLTLKAEERELLGKKVKNLRKTGLIPGHVYGKQVETEHVSVNLRDFTTVFHQAGATGLIDLKIGAEKIRPVLVKDVQYNPVTGGMLHIDFYQVNLKEKVTVAVPLVLKGEEPESVHMGETVVLQTLGEVQVEALPTDLVENIEVDITPLKQVDDAITVSQLSYDHSKLTIADDPEEVVVKLAPAVTEEMKALLEEQEQEAAAAAEAVEVQEGAEGEKVEGEGVAEENTEEASEEESKSEAEEKPSKDAV